MTKEEAIIILSAELFSKQTLDVILVNFKSTDPEVQAWIQTTLGEYCDILRRHAHEPHHGAEAYTLICQLVRSMPAGMG